jgi:hypothetical protein
MHVPSPEKALRDWIAAADEVVSIYESYEPGKADFGVRLRLANLNFDSATHHVFAAYITPALRPQIMHVLQEREREFEQERKELSRMDAVGRAVYTASFLRNFDRVAPDLLRNTANFSLFGDITRIPLDAETARKLTEKSTRLFQAIVDFAGKLPRPGLG